MLNTKEHRLFEGLKNAYPFINQSITYSKRLKIRYLQENTLPNYDNVLNYSISVYKSNTHILEMLFQNLNF